MHTCFINGEYSNTPLISPFDLGFLRGFGVFEHLRTFQKAPVFLHDHWERLKLSAKSAKIPIRYSYEKIAQIIEHLLNHNGFEESSIRLIATKGVSLDGINPINEGSLYILTSPLITPPQSQYDNGISIITTSAKRAHPQIKSLNYFDALLLLDKAREKGAQEILYTPNDLVTEGTTCNFFGIKNGTLITPSENVLEGITRKMVLTQNKMKYPIETREMRRSELMQLDEAFVTSSIRLVMGVTQIDQHPINGGKVGPITKEISKGLFELIFNQLLHEFTFNRNGLQGDQNFSERKTQSPK